MAPRRVISEIRLVNGSVGDPCLFIDYPGRHDALLFDAGDNSALPLERLADLSAVFVSHHHVDHFIGLDRIIRANLDGDKTLSVYGPRGTIRKVYDRLKSYEYPFFPFQKIRLSLHELEGAVRRHAWVECSRRFPEPEVTETAWAGPVVHEADGLSVEAVEVDHTVPCLAFALAERTGYHPDPAKLAVGALRAGPWLGEVGRRLNAGDDPDGVIEIQGGQFRLAALAERYFTTTPGARVAYVTDTRWTPALAPKLIRLAHRAQRLYCDSFYAEAQRKQADQHRHMLAAEAAELAQKAKVEMLVLIHFAQRYAGRYDLLLDEARAVFPAAVAELRP